MRDWDGRVRKRVSLEPGGLHVARRTPPHPSGLLTLGHPTAPPGGRAAVPTAH